MRRRSRTRLAAPVIWDDRTEEITICRDERCTIDGLHLSHEIKDTPAVRRARKFVLGWVLDPCEPERCARRRNCSGRRRRPLPRPTAASTRDLDAVILTVVSSFTVMPFQVLYQSVVDNLGSVPDRRVHRRLRHLRDRGQIVYLAFDPGRLISGYTTPTSKLLKDLPAIEEILWRQVWGAM